MNWWDCIKIFRQYPRYDLYGSSDVSGRLKKSSCFSLCRLLLLDRSRWKNLILEWLLICVVPDFIGHILTVHSLGRNSFLIKIWPIIAHFFCLTIVYHIIQWVNPYYYYPTYCASQMGNWNKWRRTELCQSQLPVSWYLFTTFFLWSWWIKKG